MNLDARLPIKGIAAVVFLERCEERLVAEVQCTGSSAQLRGKARSQLFVGKPKKTPATRIERNIRQVIEEVEAPAEPRDAGHEEESQTGFIRFENEKEFIQDRLNGLQKLVILQRARQRRIVFIDENDKARRRLRR